jgi:phage-related minor tail protein
MTPILIVVISTLTLILILRLEVLIMAGTDGINANLDVLTTNVGRAANELRELAGKINGNTTPEELEAVAARVAALSDGLDAVVREVDTDNTNTPAA